MRRAETECQCPAIEDRRLHGIPDLDPGLRIGAVVVPSTTLRQDTLQLPAWGGLPLTSCHVISWEARNVYIVRPLVVPKTSRSILQ